MAARREVDDRQSSVTERDHARPARATTFVVRTAVRSVSRIRVTSSALTVLRDVAIPAIPHMARRGSIRRVAGAGQHLAIDKSYCAAASSDRPRRHQGSGGGSCRARLRSSGPRPPLPILRIARVHPGADRSSRVSRCAGMSDRTRGTTAGHRFEKCSDALQQPHRHDHVGTLQAARCLRRSRASGCVLQVVRGDRVLDRRSQGSLAGQNGDGPGRLTISRNASSSVDVLSGRSARRTTAHGIIPGDRHAGEARRARTVNLPSGGHWE